MTEAERVFWGFQQFAFAVKFVAACGSNEIGIDAFQPERTVRIGNEAPITIPEWDVIDQNQLSVGAQNFLMISLGACSIAVDEALSIRNGKSSFRNWSNNQNDLNGLREIIFLIRSAYAHKMPDVHWFIDTPRRQAVYQVQTPDGLVELDTNNRHGTKLEFCHFGGLRGYVNLVNYASDLLN